HPRQCEDGEAVRGIGNDVPAAKEPAAQIAEVEDLLAYPHREDTNHERVQQPRLETQCEREDAYRPPPESVGIVRVDMKDLGDEPDARPVKQAAEEEDRLRAGSSVPAVAERETDSMGDRDGAEHHGELGQAIELVPVVADEEQRSQT